MIKKAFTLAEVLITLLIIGVVAALTIPSVVVNTQQQEFKTGLKKAVSVLNEAIQTNISQDGETPYDNEDLFTYLQRHMSILKSVNEESENWNNGSRYKNYAFYTADGMRFEVPHNDRISGSMRSAQLYETGLQFINPNIVIENRYFSRQNQSKCGSYGLANNYNDTKFPPCFMLVDVNGDRKPSYLAFNSTEGAYNYPSPSDKKLTDLFGILITDEKAIPYGVVAQRAMYSK